MFNLHLHIYSGFQDRVDLPQVVVAKVDQVVSSKMMLMMTYTAKLPVDVLCHMLIISVYSVEQ